VSPVLTGFLLMLMALAPLAHGCHGPDEDHEPAIVIPSDPDDRCDPLQQDRRK
jgi:hypothetical protein